VLGPELELEPLQCRTLTLIRTNETPSSSSSSSSSAAPGKGVPHTSTPYEGLPWGCRIPLQLRTALGRRKG